MLVRLLLFKLQTLKMYILGNVAQSDNDRDDDIHV